MKNIALITGITGQDMKYTARYAVHRLTSVSVSLISRDSHTSICIMPTWEIR